MIMQTQKITTELGVHSETGRLREVLVHRPDLSLQRLTPENCRALLFDDVLWVKKARQEHDAFVDALRERGVTVRDFGTMLAETMAIPEARAWLLDRRLAPGTVGTDVAQELRLWLDEVPADWLSHHLIGGITRAELPEQPRGLFARSLEPQDFLLPPLPNQLFTRDTSCWIYGGVSVNPMFWPARRREAYNVGAIYRGHPMFADADFEFWYPQQGDDGRLSTSDFGLASLEGGDVMP